MTRWLLILALLCTGLAPGAACFAAAAATPWPTTAATDCEMNCCGLACCCVEQNDSPPRPDAPATPPRPGDTLTPIFLAAAPAHPIVADDAPGRRFSAGAYTSSMCCREWRAMQPIICRWLT